MEEQNSTALEHVELPDSYEYARWEVILLIVAIALIVTSVGIILSI